MVKSDKTMCHVKPGNIVVSSLLKTDITPSDYEKFMQSYYFNHKFCPKCKSINHTSTLVGYILDLNNKKEYKDLNICKCAVCGDTHTAHDRI